MRPSPHRLVSRRLLALAAAALAVPLVPARAANRYWVNSSLTGNANWSNSNNWSATSGGAGGATVPGLSDTAFLNHSPNGFNISNPDLDVNASITALNIGSAGTSTPALNQNANVLFSTSASETIAYQANGRGAHNQSAGTNNVGLNLYVGYESNARGFYNLSGSGVLNVPSGTGAFYVGYRGDGTVNQSGGNANAGTLYLAYDPAASATYSLSNSASLSVTSAEFIGYGATNPTAASFAQAGGTNATPDVLVAFTDGSAGTYSLSGGTLSTTRTRIGYTNATQARNAGTFTQSGGTHSVSDLTVGGSAAIGTHTSGAYTLTDTGVLAVADATYVGYNLAVLPASPVGAFVQSGGTHTTPTLYVGGSTESTGGGAAGSYSLSAGTLTVAGPELLGDALDTGTFNQTGGTHSADQLTVAANSSFTLAGPTASLSVSTFETVYGSFSHTAGSNVVGTPGTSAPAELTIPGTYSLAGTGSLTVNGYQVVPSGGRYAQSGGDATVGSPAYPARLIVGIQNDSSDTAPATYSLSGTASVTVNGPLDLGGTDVAPGIAGVPGALALSGGTMTVTGPLRLFTPATAAANTVSLSGGTLNLPSVAGPGSAAVTISAGALNVADPAGVSVGGPAAKFSSLTLSGTGRLSAPSLTINPGPPVTVDDTASLDYSSLALAGGTLTGSAPLANPTQLSGSGTIAGTGGFANTGSLAVPSGTLTLANTGPNSSSGLVTLAPGTQLSLTGSSLANTGTLQLSAGSRLTGTATLANQAGGVITGAGTIAAPLTNSPGATLLVTTGTLTVTQPLTNAGTITLTGPAATLKINATLTNPGTLDLATGSLVLATSGTSPIQTIRQSLLTHHLFSSASDPAHRPGYLFSGEPTAPTSLLIKLTLTGDANLDGVLNADDYALLDKGFATHGTFWWQGDFNYDGAVTTADYLLIDTTYGQAQGFSPGFLATRESQFGAAYVTQLLTTIPEPTPSSILYPLSSLLLLPRRPRRRLRR